MMIKKGLAKISFGRALKAELAIGAALFGGCYTLNGLLNAKLPPQNHVVTRNGQLEKNPNIFAVQTFSADSARNVSGVLTDWPNAEIAHGAKSSEEILSSIKCQISKKGPLDDLIIYAHGTSNNIGPVKDNKSSRIDTRRLLLNLVKMKDEKGAPIAQRIIINGCDIFTNLSDADVEFYKNMAKRLNADITSSRSYYVGADTRIGNFVTFTSDGRIIEEKEKFDNAYVSVEKSLLILFSEYSGLSSRWLYKANGEEWKADALGLVRIVKPITQPLVDYAMQKAHEP